VSQYPYFHPTYITVLLTFCTYLAHVCRLSAPADSLHALALNKKASIRWQDCAPPISGYWPTSEANAGKWRSDVTAAALWGEVCATQVLPMGVGPFAFRYQGNRATPANILIALEKQLIALQLCRWQFLYNETLQQTSHPLLSKLVWKTTNLGIWLNLLIWINKHE